MDSVNHDTYVAVSQKRVQAHLRRVVAKRIDALMQQTRAVRESRHSQHTSRADCDCDDCSTCPNQAAA